MIARYGAQESELAHYRCRRTSRPPRLSGRDSGCELLACHPGDRPFDGQNPHRFLPLT